MMKVTIRLFAILRDRAGVAEMTLELPEASDVSGATVALGERFPAIREFLPRAACAVNQAYVQRSALLAEGDELALIPPVSGG